MKIFVTLVLSIALLTLLGLGGWYFYSHAHEAIPIYAGQNVTSGELWALEVEGGSPCIIEIDEQNKKPLRLKTIDEELRNLELLLDSPNVERETYLLGEIPPYTGAVEVNLHFYGQRILEIQARGRNELGIVHRRYSMNSRSELIELRELKVEPKESDESETNIKPIEFLYQNTHDEFAFSYGCMLRHLHGEKDVRDSATHPFALKSNELGTVAIEDDLDTEFQQEFIELLASVKEERSKNVQDALFDAANLPTLPTVQPNTPSAE